MVVFALGCVAGGAATLSAIYFGLRQPHLAAIFAGNALVAATAGIGWAVGALP